MDQVFLTFAQKHGNILQICGKAILKLNGDCKSFILNVLIKSHLYDARH